MSETAVFRYLIARNVAFAVIGARAMGIHGVLRFSDDTDVLTETSTTRSRASAHEATAPH